LPHLLFGDSKSVFIVTRVTRGGIRFRRQCAAGSFILDFEESPVSTITSAENLHRLVKEAIDSGAAASLEGALTLFQGFRLRIAIADAEATDPNEQAALLTTIALARRVFLGGVWVSGSLKTPLMTPLPLGRTLEQAVIALGGHIGGQEASLPLVTIGGGPTQHSAQFHIRTACAGWRGGIIPAHAEVQPPQAPVMPLAPMLAAALAVNEAFLFARYGNTAVGRRPIGLSLWNPSSRTDWLVPEEEPTLRYLPTRLWLIGLGHLGQAYLWGLGLLPYADPEALCLVLQDVDVITPSTDSTSILTTSALLGQRKTRAMAAWAERRGFNNVIVERLFGPDFRRQPCEPGVALCGLDNALGRQALDQAGFDLVVEAGLGRGYRDFRTMRLHTLPAPRSASQIWAAAQDASEDVTGRPGYEKILKDGSLDRCGITLLAGKAVGAPFVGAVAACLAISEVLRLLHGGMLCQLIDLDLQAIEHRCVVPHSFDFSALNPGYAFCSDSGQPTVAMGENDPHLANPSFFHNRFAEHFETDGETHA
jgi:hypothetical protein